MIYGIGIDILSIQRVKIIYSKFQLKFAHKILSVKEFRYFINLHDNKKINFLAKRFCVKEAFAKSLRTGLRNPVLFRNIILNHNSFGHPYLTFSVNLQQWLTSEKIHKIHVSLSDEKDKVISFVISENND